MCVIILLQDLCCMGWFEGTVDEWSLSPLCRLDPLLLVGRAVMKCWRRCCFLYVHKYVYNCSFCTCGLPVPTSCNALLVVCSLYRTGLIKDLLLCSGYQDSSSLRPS